MSSLLFANDSGRKKSRKSGSGRAWLLVAVVLLVAGGGYGAVLILGGSGDAEPPGSGEIGKATEVRTPPHVGASGRRTVEASGSEDRRGTGGRTESSTDGEAVAQQPAVSSGEPSPQAELLKAEGLRLERIGKILEARATYAKALATQPTQPNTAQQRAIASRIEGICRRTILGPTVVPGETEAAEYEVQSGDYLSTIGRKFSIPYELIMRINSLPSDRIYRGQKLKVIKGPFTIRIIKSELLLEVWLRNLLVKTYPVAIGKEDRTPAGRYSVGIKQVDPAFSPPPSQKGIMKPVVGGEPDNPLGSRWIGFGNHLGIHGTNEPASIGKRVSLGCIRMRNADVERVYDFVVPQLSKVEIVESRSR
ncbi:MAG: L,D-transpeptidase family protein [Anaerolineaceae bacterium]|nr:L,D-transpeptidase family protein [Anaerolineaceae bacterium]